MQEELIDKDYEKALERFNWMIGSYISARINSEYLLGLSEMYDLTTKGEKTKQSAVICHEERTCKLVKLLEADLKSKAIDVGIAEEQVSRIEGVIHACLYLDEDDCKRVMGLIRKIRAEKPHVYTLNPDEPAREYSQLVEA